MSAEESTSVDFEFQIDERDITFDLDEELYPLDAMYGAAYLFLDRCYVFFTRPADRRVRVRLRTQQAAPSAELEELAGKFANELLNQVLRVRIGRSTGALREQVLARAFAPSGTDSTIAQLLAELDAEELDEEPLEIAVPWETKHEAGDKPPGGQDG
ncbi:MAG: His-Xaa-Ser system protein HxsD [Deltaproteobacteria bacterium]|jgi:His-Xaa-Ser system protein HxsD|nr:His-Xaa-Ser system protein HxsD [Deltaproteobacteria bacterium]MBW2533159.1 His-Xaa-Ser system protein HxsD [Deltaproteobacteria bacterium]